eukprot:TRINITY_DN269_c0_g1_i1.p1 TRINITY_DN269_c0_g1~~TRINITY_DN269_c0_g1_i1.p1  ORF type:complete len:651 (+),score=172.68 TRINITY_DN269_c0_g1_i1:194-2146(+)
MRRVMLLVGSALGVAAGALATLSADSVAIKPRVRPVYLDMFKTEAAMTALEEGISLSVTPTELPSSGSWVEVTWSGLSAAAGNEFIAWYSPASALSDVTAVAPVKYQFLSANCTAPCSKGVLRFRLLNLRDEEGYAAGLFRGGLDAPVLVASTTGGDKAHAATNLALTNAAVTFANPHSEVLHPHLALTGVPGEMRVSWVTGTPPTEASPPQRVQWRDVRSLSSTRERGADSSTYTREDMCDAPAATVGFHDPGLQHSAVMQGLEAGATYEYTISGQFTGRFTMAPERGSRGAVRVAVFGDMGTAEMDGALDTNEQDERASLQTVSLLARMLDPPAAAPQPPLGLVLHIGDISYARGFDVQWDEFFDQIAPVATLIPWMVAPGNHERDAPLPSTSTARPQTSYYRGYDSGGECGVPYSWRLPMPGPGAAPAADAPWYGFDYGPIHFTVMSTEHDFRPGSAQHAFLAADLATCDRGVTPWLVFAGHRPMYVDSVGPGADECGPDDPTPCPWDQPVSRELRRAVEPLLLKHKVDLALWGHHHSYQRTCHVVGGRCAAPSAALAGGASGDGSTDAYRGPVHLVVGMAGYELTTNTHAARPPIFEYVNTWEHGVAALDANATHLAAGFYVDATGRLGDAVTLFRPPPSPQAAYA